MLGPYVLKFASIDKIFHFWIADGPKFKIDLHGRYVAQNLQKCVLIIIQFSESKSNFNWDQQIV